MGPGKMKTILSNSFRNLIAVIFILGFAPPALSAAVNPVDIFLIQNSGWMEAFYVDPNSRFKPLVKKLVYEATNAGNSNDVVICAFNEALPGNPSPACSYRGKFDQAKIDKAVDSIELAHKPNSSALADTNFVEAITKITSDLEAKGREGILWIVTNNKNSPNNNTNTASLNKQYYDKLHGYPAIERVIAFPYKMVLHGPHYDASGLMVYGIGFGKNAGQQLKQKMFSANLSKLFGGASPARLKPLNEEAVTFVPKGSTKSDDVNVFLGKDGKTIEITFQASSVASKVDIKGVFRNDFYPYTIEKANIFLLTNLNSANVKSSVSVRSIQKLEPGTESSPLNIHMELPPLQSQWSTSVIFEGGYKVLGTLELTLANQELGISKDFVGKMNNLFPNDPLPDLFRPSSQSRQSVTKIPVVITVLYPVGPLLIILFVSALLLIGGVALWLISRRTKKVTVIVDGKRTVVNLMPGKGIDLKNEAGEHVATLKQSLFGPKLVIKSTESTVKIL